MTPQSRLITAVNALLKDGIGIREIILMVRDAVEEWEHRPSAQRASDATQSMVGPDMGVAAGVDPQRRHDDVP